MQRYDYNRLGILAKQLFRLAELFVALQIIWCTYTRLHYAVKISGEYFRELFTVIASPLFAFILCHGIIIYLIAKSSARFSGQQNQSANNVVEAQLYDYRETIPYENNNNNQRTSLIYQSSPTTFSSSMTPSIEEDIMHEDKQNIISEVSTINIKNYEVDTDHMDSDTDSGYHPKAYKTRMHSEKFNRECSVKKHEELCPSETEKFPNDMKLSDEEFNRSVDAFIAKQLRFRRHESLSIALSNQS
ncbi:uncharacterized protein LOC132804011 [Ziziphus jujuba]|uniref:Uncharacterized protein LOC132804011 n=1 Tax=Ziziphus jujuba TaxID=326968 RepID=A0ABM4AAV9_ZIZJJ|nr:uncharacterized protein LOC132804011 [Ziziphus jujuba]